MRTTLSSLAAALLASTSLAADRQEAAVAGVVEGRVRDGEPGIAVLVRQDGRTVFSRGYGVRDLRSRERIDAATGFRLASVTKAFTATAVQLLVRDGQLRYEDALTDVFPAFPAWGRGVTIRHLLTHTSGLPDYEDLMAEAGKGRAPLWTAERQIRDDEVLALLRGETKGLFPPGTSWAYSNSGYVVLGLVVARVSGKPFPDFLRERVSAPLGMNGTLAYEKERSEVRRRAFGHARDGAGFREADQSPTSATLGDGGVYSSLEDLARWDEALRADALLSPAWTKAALTPVRLADGSETRWPPGRRGGDGLDPGQPVSYGFGWFLDPWRGRARAWHHGETTGFRSVIERFTDDRLTVVVLANRDDLDVRALALEVAGSLLDGPRGGEAGALDRATACKDFDALANGEWRAANPAPPWASRWNRRLAAEEAERDRRNGLLSELSASAAWPRGSVEQRLGDHYAACMDEAKVEALGLEPVRPLLAEIDGLADIASVQRTVGALHALGIPVPFAMGASPDPRDPRRTIPAVRASGLGLADRGHYLKAEPAARELREKYRTHVAHVIELGGASRAASRRAADAVVAMERDLAAATLDPADRPRLLPPSMSFVDLTNLAPDFDWPSYFAAAKLSPSPVVVEEPDFLRAVDRLFLEAPLASWKAYLKWHLLRSASPHLGSAFAKEAFAFEQVTGGAKERRPRWKGCVDSVGAVFGEALAAKAGEGRVPAPAVARVRALVRSLAVATADTLRGFDGMGKAAKAKALERLATLDLAVSVPEEPKGASGVPVGRDTLWANVAAARQWRVGEERSRIGSPKDPARPPVAVSSPSYDPVRNQVVVPPALLRPPALRDDATDAVSYGGLGVLVGQEMARAFPIVVAGAAPGPAAAEAAGARIAHRAYRRSREGLPPEPTLDGLTPEQQLFVAWAQLRGEPAASEPLLALPEFREAFGCAGGLGRDGR